eukprot:119511-Pelagomonas_calceolata.AAC.1
MLAGEDQSQADQPNSLAEGPPLSIHLDVIGVIKEDSKTKLVLSQAPFSLQISCPPLGIGRHLFRFSLAANVGRDTC